MHCAILSIYISSIVDKNEREISWMTTNLYLFPLNDIMRERMIGTLAIFHGPSLSFLSIILLRWGPFSMSLSVTDHRAILPFAFVTILSLVNAAHFRSETLIFLHHGWYYMCTYYSQLSEACRIERIIYIWIVWKHFATIIIGCSIAMSKYL